jgi:hypothetical protein
MIIRCYFKLLHTHIVTQTHTCAQNSLSHTHTTLLLYYILFILLRDQVTAHFIFVNTVHY